MSDTPVDEQPVEETLVAEPKQDEAREEKHFEPRGAFAFVLLMLAFYAIYYAVMYVQIFVDRLGN